VRQEALIVAGEQEADWILIDGSPGIGCPVIAAVTGVDLALLVAEPTLSGIHDMRRALEVADHFRVPTAVCVNKCDINPQLTEEIIRFCKEQDIPMWSLLPYDEIVLEAMRDGLAVTELLDNPVARGLRTLWRALQAGE
jgi:MinD superfamily P-loop ATPase